MVRCTSRRSGQPDIYLQSVGGQNAINLTKDSPAADDEPAFSPDGERIAFRSARDGGGLRVMGRTGEAPGAVGPNGPNPPGRPMVSRSCIRRSRRRCRPASWPPAGLRAVRIDTGEVKEIAKPDALHPAWSPKGGSSRSGALGRMPDGGLTADGTSGWWRRRRHTLAESPTTVTSTGARHGPPTARRSTSASNRGGSMNLWRIAVDPEPGAPRSEPQARHDARGVRRAGAISSKASRLVYEARETTSNIYRGAFDARAATVGAVRSP